MWYICILYTYMYEHIYAQASQFTTGRRCSGLVHTYIYYYQQVSHTSHVDITSIYIPTHLNNHTYIRTLKSIYRRTSLFRTLSLLQMMTRWGYTMGQPSRSEKWDGIILIFAINFHIWLYIDSLQTDAKPEYGQ